MILLDCDGVLADLVGALAARVGFQKHEVVDHNFRACFDAQTTKRIYDEMLDPKLHDEVQPTIARFDTSEVLCVTAPFTSAGDWTKSRASWLAQHYGIKPENTLFVPGKHKHRVQGRYLVEDHPVTASQWSEHNGRISFLVDQPWNRGHAVHGYVKRIGLKELAELLGTYHLTNAPSPSETDTTRGHRSP